MFVYRFAAHLDLEDKANAVALTALRIVGRMQRDWIVSGRRPAGICAAALLIASRAHGFSRSKHDVTKVLRVCGMTVNARVKEFEYTPSSSLTLNQFHEYEIEAEADPPCFTKNRIKEVILSSKKCSNNFGTSFLMCLMFNRLVTFLSRLELLQLKRTMLRY